MTYNDIQRKFLIEYDKDNVTSSYPSLTKYEIATILDKAYLALIAQKFTGANQRQAPFEIDIKAISELQPLITKEFGISSVFDAPETEINKNTVVFNLLNRPTTEKILYYVSSTFKWPEDSSFDKKAGKIDPISIISHEDAQNFIQSSVNIPWIKTPVATMNYDSVVVYVDTFDFEDSQLDLLHTDSKLNLTYIKEPTKFVDSINMYDETYFELDDSMAEQLINLAIVMALETVQSSRLQTKEQLRTLEV